MRLFLAGGGQGPPGCSRPSRLGESAGTRCRCGWRWPRPGCPPAWPGPLPPAWRAPGRRRARIRTPCRFSAPARVMDLASLLGTGFMMLMLAGRPPILPFFCFIADFLSRAAARSLKVFTASVFLPRGIMRPPRLLGGNFSLSKPSCPVKVAPKKEKVRTTCKLAIAFFF